MFIQTSFHNLPSFVHKVGGEFIVSHELLEPAEREQSAAEREVRGHA